LLRHGRHVYNADANVLGFGVRRSNIWDGLDTVDLLLQLLVEAIEGSVSANFHLDTGTPHRCRRRVATDYNPAVRNSPLGLRHYNLQAKSDHGDGHQFHERLLCERLPSKAVTADPQMLPNVTRTLLPKCDVVKQWDFVKLHAGEVSNIRHATGEEIVDAEKLDRLQRSTRARTVRTAKC
jgi:hypothetical protein